MNYEELTTSSSLNFPLTLPLIVAEKAPSLNFPLRLPLMLEINPEKTKPTVQS